MSENNVVFKNSLGGYKKSDVNNYLAAVSAEMKSKDELYGMQKERLEKEIEAEKSAKLNISAQLDELGFELFSVQGALSAAEARETELKNTVTGLSARVSELEEALAVKTEEARASAEELEKLGHMVGIENEENDDIVQKAALYDKLSDRIGEIMLKADSNAEEILTGAMERSDEIISNAQAEAGEIVRSADKEAEGLRNRYKDAASEYYDEVAVFVAEVRDCLDVFIREIGAKSSELESKIDYMHIAGAPDVKPEIQAKCEEKEEVQPEKKEPVQAEEKQKKSYSAIDEKIEKFFKNTMAAINAFKSK